MPGTLIADELDLTHDAGLPPAGHAGDGGDGAHDPGAPRVPARAYYTGMSLALAGIFMFFMALVSSYIVRKADPNWRKVDLPAMVWVNTAILVVSSITLSRSLQFLRKHDGRRFGRWWRVTTILGLLFLAGQVLAWRQLAAAGVFVASNPASSFFYLLTGVHGVHLLGGVLALLYVSLRGWQHASVTQGTAAGVTAVYWHFMDGLWVFLFLVLQLGG
jgi:cytochrome c oxidase subunit 3